jgi:hypothetical protein
MFNGDMSLTIKDLKLIKEVVKVTVDEELDVKLDEKFEEKLSYLPTKEEFYEREDKIMAELKSVREEIAVISNVNRKVNDHKQRIGKIEKKLGLEPAL